MACRAEHAEEDLAAAQARCREMEREIETLTTCGCEGCDDNLEESAFCFPCMNKVQKQVTQLQATLTAREEVIGQQEATIRGYRHSIKIIGQQHDDRKAERDAAVQEAGRLRGVLEKIAKPALGGKQQQWMAQEALKAQQARGSSGGAANQGAGT